MRTLLQTFSLRSRARCCAAIWAPGGVSGDGSYVYAGTGNTEGVCYTLGI